MDSHILYYSVRVALMMRCVMNIQVAKKYYTFIWRADIVKRSQEDRLQYEIKHVHHTRKIP